MNAYELADLIEEDMEEGFGMGFLQDAVNMLRQQADRIAELEKAFISQRVEAYAKSLTDRTKASAIAKVLNAEPFIWLKQDFDGEWIEVHPNKGIPLYTTPQIKELSDGEIQDLIVNKVTDADMIRQALKKASEK